MQIEDMVKALETCGKRETDPLAWESVLYYYGSIMMNKYNLRKASGSPLVKYYSIVFAPSGVGKALANSEPVLTSTGWKQMDQLTLSDKVIDSNGYSTKINSIHPQGLRNIYTVLFKDGTSVNCDLEHLWTVTNREGKQQTLTVQDMLHTWISKDRFDKRYGTYQKTYNYSIPYAEPSHFGSNKSINIDPYLLGLLLGDGGFTGHESKISFTNGKINLINEVEKRLPSTDKIGYKKFKQGAWHTNIITKKDYQSTTTIYKQLKKYKLNGLKSKDKFIPQNYLTGSLKTRQALYQGLIDTDGYVVDGKLKEYSTSSKQLAEDFLELGRSIGKVLTIKERIPTYTYKGQKKKGLLSYRIYEAKKHKNGKSIVDISYSHAEPATCITIDSKDKLFVTSGYNLTHNSYIIKRVEGLCGLDQYSDIMMSYYNTHVDMLPERPDASEVLEMQRYMPKSITIGTEGTSEGLYQVAQSQKASGFGSLNLSTEEFTEYISGSSGLLSKLKELYDSTFKSKIIKGDSDSEIKKDINNLIVNFIGLGSKKAATKEAKDELKRIASSGLYRRTYIIDSKITVSKNTKEENIEDLTQYLHELNETYKNDFIERRKIDIFSEKFMTLHENYIDHVDKIDDELISRAQSNKLNEFAQYDTGSLEIIESLAHIIAFLEWDMEVSPQHLDKAFSFFERTRATVEDTFKSIHPYKTMYDLLHLKDNMTISEMAEIEADIPISKTKVADNIALLQELCYRNDEVLIQNEGKVVRLRIEPLPINKLDKLILSVHNEGQGTYAVNFKPLEVSWEQLHKLVVSEKIESFSTSHFDPTPKAPDGHRQAPSHIEGSNLIAFDIDNGMTIAEAQQMLSEYTYLIYTSKSHNIEKYDYRDRFRILLPTKNKFYVTSDQHKQLYINIEDFLGIQNNDIQTRNVSRLWFTNPEGTIFENKGELIDVTFLLPNTDKSDEYIPKMIEINETYDASSNSEENKRISGMIKWAIMNASEGQRNSTLYNLGKFMVDLGMDPEDTLNRVNSMIIKPLSEPDIRQLLRSISR